MFKANSRYWWCQFLGWGFWGVIILYFNLVVFGDRFAETGGKKEFTLSLVLFLITGIITTHILRMMIKSTNWLRYAFNKIVLLFIVGVAAAGIIMYYLDNLIEHNTPFSYDNYILKQKLEKANKMESQYGLSDIPYYTKELTPADSTIAKAITDIRKTTSYYRNKNGEWKHENKSELLGIYQNLLLIAIWLLIYIVYHYVQKNRNDQLDRLRLESTVKELELKTIKAHINPHFIFNALNSIRALVDENPVRARTAITELSNILRSSMHAEKMETVPLENELNIVKDYLALEQMRFEERLKVEMEIDEDTLDQPIPPMMLQTLVENAIKHGISKKVNGGTIRIVSDFVDDHHELIVQNSGQLNGNINGDGFGVRSTQDRLNLLYQGKATFDIRNLDGEMVESRIIMPVANI